MTVDHKYALSVKVHVENIVIEATDGNDPVWAATVHVSYNTLLLDKDIVANVVAQAVSLLSAEVQADISQFKKTSVN